MDYCLVWHPKASRKITWVISKVIGTFGGAAINGKRQGASAFDTYKKRICVIVRKWEMGQCHLPLFTSYPPEYFPSSDLEIAVFSPLNFFQGSKNCDGWMGWFFTVNLTDMKMIHRVKPKINRIVQLEGPTMIYQSSCLPNRVGTAKMTALCIRDDFDERIIKNGSSS